MISKEAHVKPIAVLTDFNVVQNGSQVTISEHKAVDLDIRGTMTGNIIRGNYVRMGWHGAAIVEVEPNRMGGRLSLPPDNSPYGWKEFAILIDRQ